MQKSIITRLSNSARVTVTVAIDSWDKCLSYEGSPTSHWALHFIGAASAIPTRNIQQQNKTLKYPRIRTRRKQKTEILLNTLKERNRNRKKIALSILNKSVKDVSSKYKRNIYVAIWNNETGQVSNTFQKENRNRVTCHSEPTEFEACDRVTDTNLGGIESLRDTEIILRKAMKIPRALWSTCDLYYCQQRNMQIISFQTIGGTTTEISLDTIKKEIGIRKKNRNTHWTRWIQSETIPIKAKMERFKLTRRYFRTYIFQSSWWSYLGAHR